MHWRTRVRMKVSDSILILLVAMSATIVRAQPGPDDLPVKAPKDAKVLFDGKDTSQWVTRTDGSPCPWKIIQGAMQAAQDYIVTKDKFKDFTLHVEFWLPNAPETVKGQGRGNSGVYLQGRYEIQVLDSFGVQKPNQGDCGAVYGVKAP